MGKISRSIILQVPVEVAYQAVKNNEMEEYFPQDLQKKAPSTRIIKDVENSLLSTESKKWYVKVETEYLFRSLNEDSCEITFNVKYPPLSPEPMIKPLLNLEISGYKTLEFGYKKGKEYGAQRNTNHS